jgi:hypothetical protein
MVSCFNPSPPQTTKISHIGEDADNNKVGGEKETDFEEVKLAKRAKMDPDSSKRKGARVTCGADVVIKDVMPFLMLE